MPNLRRKPRPGHREHEVVGELVEGPLDAEVGAEGEREDARVGREVAARVVADEQDRPLLGDVAQPADLAAEAEAGQQPQAGQVARGCSRGRARRGRRPGCALATWRAAARAARPASDGPPSAGAGAVRRRRRRPRRAALTRGRRACPLRRALGGGGGAPRSCAGESTPRAGGARAPAAPSASTCGEEALQQAVGLLGALDLRARGRSRRARSARRAGSQSRDVALEGRPG